MKKLILKIFIALIILLGILTAAGIWYVQKVFLPEKLKPLILQAAKSNGVNIDFKDIVYKFPGSIAVRNFCLFEKNIPQQKLLTIKEATAQFRLLPIILKKQIVITRVDLETLEVFPGPGHTFISKGDAFLDGEFSVRLNDPNSLFYRAVLTLKNQDIRNMPLVKNISRMNGQINIEPDKISIIKLKGFSFDCPVEFAGYLENFKDPYLNLTESIDLDLARIDKFLSPKINKSIKQIRFAGKSAVILNMSGKFSEWPLKFNGTAKVLNAQAQITALANPIKAINGEVTFDGNSLSVPQVTAQYNDQMYTFKANLTDFSAPSIYAVLSSQDLLLEAKLKSEEDYLRFDAIDANWFNSTLNLVGEIQDYSNPKLKLSGEAKINLEDIQNILLRIVGKNENISGLMKTLKAKGVCAMGLFADGLINDFGNCELGIKAVSENINIAGFNLGAMDASAQLKNKIFVVPKMDFTPYDGTLKIQDQFDFNPKENQPAPFYSMDINAANLNLEKLIKDTEFKNNNIWGIFSGMVSLSGTGNDPNSLKGTGWIMVTDGHLWEFPLLGGLADALRLPMLKNVQIKEATGNFIVADKKISTENLQFSSPQLNMAARGNLGFAGELDFNIGLSFTSDFARQNELVKLAMLLVDETGRLLGQLNLSGTLKEPKYTFVPLHLDKIFKSQLMQGIQKIFKKQ